MYKQKIGISVRNNYSIPTLDVIKMLHEIGFDAISPVWNRDVNLTEIIEHAKKNGLTIQSLHAPFHKAASMWSHDEKLYIPAKEELIQALNDCKTFAIPIMVVHAWIGFEYEFDASELNFQNYDEIISFAEQCGVKIAFENTEGEEYLFALLEHYKTNHNVGFCWDSGHEMCYNHSQDLLAKFGERLFMTHLNDNLGIRSYEGKICWTDDLHLLPYDGIADWDNNIERLKKAKHMDILNFEVNINSKPNRHENDIYEHMNIEQYFTEAYKRACKIAYKYSR